MTQKIQTDPRYSGWNFTQEYTQLPAVFYQQKMPVPVASPRLILANHALMADLGLAVDALDNAEGAAFFAGNLLPQGLVPFAQSYAGHQFGHFTLLGDGRVLMLGEHHAPNGQQMDIQFKGSGPTRFSRGGDGRAALGPMLREYLISEAMHGLGISTTRSLAVVSTGESVRRERILPGAILTRVAVSHLRVGTFEFAARQADPAALRLLAEYTLRRLYPETLQAAEPFQAFFQEVLKAQARLVAQWMLVGFVHGVMNTDNMTISGETIDYGPCAFMDRYDPETVLSSIDSAGRYAYSNQPAVAQWNLARFAETLLPLVHPEPDQAVVWAEDALQDFPALFMEHWLHGMRLRFGFHEKEEADADLVTDFLHLLRNFQADYTNSFRALAENRLQDALFLSEDFLAWQKRWQERLHREARPATDVTAQMQAHCPACIPRNYHVEKALKSAEQGDISYVHRLLTLLSTPYASLDPEDAQFADPGPLDETYRTFCGT